MSKRKNKGKFKSRKELIESIKHVSSQSVYYILKSNELEKQLQTALSKIAELEEIAKSESSAYLQTLINKEVQRRLEETK